ncbi:putative histone acetyltransferase [Clavispora lusitaniae]|uniref:Histone acetyltransferase n=1 Tax=Clavispora lusitaniae TaxID=36911 RepID=A0ACD0WJU5_CLALS|nr:putative histone acetyltransferase [Clavispora lusitaniae]QFZ32881.1 putative histone acetyltransferase [Clavispora lusitaniae]QFZ38551.1 putative histone acetyltransferase [Clavispora lusitaniae]QFZ44233.1 putative histone acetyltransferase [Clavispora lusitaniae]QFZ49911.1 putative histone acetyltransferase [Clavispora lusitaniae]
MFIRPVRTMRFSLVLSLLTTRNSIFPSLSSMTEGLSLNVYSVPSKLNVVIRLFSSSSSSSLSLSFTFSSSSSPSALFSVSSFSSSLSSSSSSSLSASLFALELFSNASSSDLPSSSSSMSSSFTAVSVSDSSGGLGELSINPSSWNSSSSSSFTSLDRPPFLRFEFSFAESVAPLLRSTIV